MINTLFEINPDGELEINKPEARKIKEYAVLFNRDTGSVGDASGKKKLIACAEILYIYLVYDVRSLYYNLPIEERKVQAIRDAKLPDNWREDKDLQLAVERYLSDFKLTSAGRAYVVAEKAYHTIAKDVEDLQETLVDLKALLKAKAKKLGTKYSTNIQPMEINTLATEINAIILDISKTQKTIMDNIGGFDKLGETVKKLSVKFAEEGGSMRLVVGGREIYNRED